MSGIIRDLKAARKKISEGEQVLYLIWALPIESQHLNHVKTILNRSDTTEGSYRVTWMRNCLNLFAC